MSGSEHGRPNVKLYLTIFAVLMVLTVVTVLVSYFHLPPAQAITIGLGIAAFKAGLVAAYFMHLKGERLLIFGVLALTVLFTGYLFLVPFTDSVALSDKVVHAQAAPAQPGAE